MLRAGAGAGAGTDGAPGGVARGAARGRGRGRGGVPVLRALRGVFRAGGPGGAPGGGARLRGPRRVPGARLLGALGGGRARRAPPGGALGGLPGLVGGGDFGEEQPGQWQTPPLDPEFAAGPSGGPLSGRGLQALGLEPEHGRGDWEDAGEGEPDFDFDVRRLLESLPGLRAEGLRAEGLGLQLHGEPLWLEHGGASGGGGEEEDEEESAWAGQGCRRGDLPGQAPASPGNARPGAAGARTGRPREQPVSESQLLERAIQGQYATDLLLSALEL